MEKEQGVKPIGLAKKIELVSDKPENKKRPRKRNKKVNTAVVEAVVVATDTKKLTKLERIIKWFKSFKFTWR